LAVHLVFLYDKNVKYSVNAVVASIDRLEGIRVHLAKGIEDLVTVSSTVRSRGFKCISAISLLTTMLASNGFYEVLKSTVNKLKNMGCITVCGGPHPSGDPLGTLSFFNFDYAFVGEAEESFKEFVLAVRDGLDPRSSKGLAYLENGGKFVYTGRRKPISLDDHDPFPYWRGIFGPVEITRGCPYGCFYCQVSYIHGFQYRHRSVDKIVFYVEEYMKRGGRDVRFLSPDSLAYGARSATREVNIGSVEELLSNVRSIVEKHGGRVFLGSFPSEVRPEHVTSEVMRVLKKYISNKAIIVGAQSGSQRLLKAIKRQHSVDDVVNAVKTIREWGFVPVVDLIVGFPGENPEDMDSTIELAKKVVELGGKVHLHHYIPLPGSPLGTRPPSTVPQRAKKELSRIVGMGKGYGNWIQQEKLAWSIVELHRRGVILPSTRS